MGSGRLTLLIGFFLCVVVSFANSKVSSPNDDCNAPIYDNITYIVDNKAILNVIPGYLAAEVSLKNLRKKNEDDLRDAYEKYQNDVNDFENKKNDMSTNERTKHQDLLRLKQSKLQMRAEEMEREYEIKSDEKLKPFIDKLNNIIRDAMKGRDKVNVIDKRFVSYYDKKLDITDFIKRKIVASLQSATNKKEKKD